MNRQTTEAAGFGLERACNGANGRRTAPLKVGVVCDLLEERWLSMDLVADMLLAQLASGNALGMESGGIEAIRIRPKPGPRFARIPFAGRTRVAFTADRLLHRFWDYPRILRRQAARCDVYHIVDHSYAQLVHELPAERTIVTCHDLDTFRCVLEPARDPRSRLFRHMTRRILSGLRKAARITCDSQATLDGLVAHDLCAPGQAVVIPNGVDPFCSPEPHESADREASRLLGPQGRYPVDLLHVGSAIPRKRLDILLRVFAAVRREAAGVRLVRAGGGFTDGQKSLVRDLGLEDAIVVLPYLDRDVLAAVYRRAAMVLQPSEAEGFGLPVAEAMACGTAVVATDIPVLREMGEEAAVYCPLADIDAWRDTILELLQERHAQPERWNTRLRAGIDRAAHFTWENYARRMSDLYREIGLP